MTARTERLMHASLRFWSDRVPLGEVATRIGLETNVLHMANAPMAESGRLAPRHYLSAEGRDCTGLDDVETWLGDALTRLSSDRALCDALHEGQISACAWIAIFPDYAGDRLSAGSHFVDRARALRLSVLQEDYDRLDEDGIPPVVDLTTGKRLNGQRPEDGARDETR